MSIWTSEFKHPIDYLTQELGLTDLLLMENDDLIALEQTGTGQSLWVTETKN